MLTDNSNIFGFTPRSNIDPTYWEKSKQMSWDTFQTYNHYCQIIERDFYLSSANVDNVVQFFSLLKRDISKAIIWYPKVPSLIVVEFYAGCDIVLVAKPVVSRRIFAHLLGKCCHTCKNQDVANTDYPCSQCTDNNDEFLRWRATA